MSSSETVIMINNTGNICDNGSALLQGFVIAFDVKAGSDFFVSK